MKKIIAVNLIAGLVALAAGAADWSINPIVAFDNSGTLSGLTTNWSPTVALQQIKPHSWGYSVQCIATNAATNGCDVALAWQTSNDGVIWNTASNIATSVNSTNTGLMYWFTPGISVYVRLQAIVKSTNGVNLWADLVVQ